MDDKPKSALDWIRWGSEQKRKTAAETPPPVLDDLMASPPESPVEIDEPEPESPPEDPAPSLDAEPAMNIIETPELEAVDDAPEPAEPAPEPPAAATPPPAAEPRPPGAANSTVTIPEDAAYAFSVADFNFDESDDQPITQVKIVSLAGVGSMRFDHEQVLLGQTMSRTDIEAGKFVFLPATSGNAISHDTFLFKVSDGKTWTRVAYTMTVETAPAD